MNKCFFKMENKKCILVIVMLTVVKLQKPTLERKLWISSRELAEGRRVTVNIGSTVPGAGSTDCMRRSKRAASPHSSLPSDCGCARVPRVSAAMALLPQTSNFVFFLELLWSQQLEKSPGQLYSHGTPRRSCFSSCVVFPAHVS